MILRKLISLRAFLLFTWKTHCGLKFYFGQFDRSEICIEVSFTPPEVIWTLIMKLPHTEVKFYPEVRSQTGLSSLQIPLARSWSISTHYSYCCSKVANARTLNMCNLCMKDVQNWHSSVPLEFMIISIYLEHSAINLCVL